jgi:cobalamin synthase
MGAGIYFAILHLFLPRSAAALPIKLDELLVATLWGALAFLPRERRRFGIAGAIAIAAGIAIRWLALDALAPGRTIEVFIASQTVPRAAIVAIAWASRPAGEGAGHEFSTALRTPIALIAIAEGIAAALLCGLRPGLAILAGAYVIIRAVRGFSYRYSGGVNADSFGATQSLIEIFVLLLFTCGACRW